MSQIIDVRTGKIVSDTDLKLEHLYRESLKKTHMLLSCEMSLDKSY